MTSISALRCKRAALCKWFVLALFTCSYALYATAKESIIMSCKDVEGISYVHVVQFVLKAVHCVLLATLYFFSKLSGICFAVFLVDFPMEIWVVLPMKDETVMHQQLNDMLWKVGNACFASISPSLSLIRDWVGSSLDMIGRFVMCIVIGFVLL